MSYFLESEASCMDIDDLLAMDERASTTSGSTIILNRGVDLGPYRDNPMSPPERDFLEEKGADSDASVIPLRDNRPHKAWVFTRNNFTEKDKDLLKGLEKNYLVFGEEIGESGTPHLQGYITFKNGYRFTALSKILHGFHIEPRKATEQLAANYCMKGANVFKEDNRKKQGSRTDLRVATELAIKEGRSALLTDMPWMYVKYHAGFDKLVLMKSRTRTWKTKVYWIYGPTGAGKSRFVFEKYANDALWVSSGTLRWFDGYEDQKTILLDDFRADQITFSLLLRLFDRYTLQMPVKGGFRQILAEEIYVTCPSSPEVMFREVCGFARENIDQLLR